MQEKFIAGICNYCDLVRTKKRPAIFNLTAMAAQKLPSLPSKEVLAHG